MRKMRLVILLVCAGVLSSACSGKTSTAPSPTTDIRTIPLPANLQAPPSAPGFSPIKISLLLPGSEPPTYVDILVTVIQSDPDPKGRLVDGQTARVVMDLRGPSGGYGVALDKRFVKGSSDAYDPCKGTSGGLMYVSPKGDGTMTASMPADSNTAGVAKLVLYFWFDKGDAAAYRVGVSCAEKTQEVPLDWGGPK